MCSTIVEYLEIIFYSKILLLSSEHTKHSKMLFLCVKKKGLILICILKRIKHFKHRIFFLSIWPGLQLPPWILSPLRHEATSSF